jgi:tetratricopeptide (TPR) repeat protein
LQPQQDVRSCAVSPDGRWVATGSHWNTDGLGAKVWEAATGKLVKELPVPGLCEVAFSPDGRWLLTNSGGCRLWEVGSWDKEPKVVGGANACFSPDGQLLAVEDTPGAIRLVRPEDRAELARLEAPEQTRLQPRCFTPDGTRLIAVGVDTQALHVWDLRAIRRGLAEIGLDWDALPYPPLDKNDQAAPLEITVDLGELAPARKPPEQSETDKLRQEAEKQSQAIAKNPNDAEAYYQRGRLYNRLKEFPKARDDFDRAIALKADHFEAHHHRGHAHEGLGEAHKAIDDFSAALRGQPQNAHLYYARGRNYSRLKEYAKAMKDLNRALELKLASKAEQANACNSLAWIQVAGPAEFRAPEKALPLAQKAVELAPDNRAYCHTLGMVHYRLSQYKEAVEALERGIKNNKGQETAFDLFFLAMCHAKLGDAAKAKDCYDRAVRWQKQAKLSPQQVEELRAFRAEAESLLPKANP